ncbi:hypothetical protein D1872_294130 [compost metagenome]
MRIGVVGDLVPFTVHSRRNPWMRFHFLTDHKKGRPSTRAAEDLKQLMRIYRVRSIVKCEGDYLFLHINPFYQR